MDISKTDGPGGCEIVIEKFFKEFPRIARNMIEVEGVIQEGLSNEYLFNKIERDDEENDDDGRK